MTIKLTREQLLDAARSLAMSHYPYQTPTKLKIMEPTPDNGWEYEFEDSTTGGLEDKDVVLRALILCALSSDS